MCSMLGSHSTSHPIKTTDTRGFPRHRDRMETVRDIAAPGLPGGNLAFNLVV
jgi:hypothetical protein